MKPSLPNTLTVRPRRSRFAWSLVLLLSPVLVWGDSELTPSPSEANPGIFYTNDRIANVPWSIHVLKIDRGRTDLKLTTTLGQGTILGLSTLAQQIQSLPRELGRPVAGINGDFYVTDRGLYIGDPRGLQIMEGELVSGPADQSTFWIDTAGNPQMGNVVSQFKVTWPDGSATPIGINEERSSRGAVLYTPRLGPSTRAGGGREFVLERAGEGPWLPLCAGLTYTGKVSDIRDTGDTPLRPQQMVLSVGSSLAGRFTNVAVGAELKISMATVPDLTGVKAAIGGGSVLIRNGKKEELKMPLSLAYKYRSATERHPRSAIGTSRKYIYLVEVDGRQRGLSAGMTLAELADYMVQLGCELAMNLDGGNSATFWLNGKVMNSPSGPRPRDIANGLVVVQKEKAPKP